MAAGPPSRSCKGGDPCSGRRGSDRCCVPLVGSSGGVLPHGQAGRLTHRLPRRLARFPAKSTENRVRVNTNLSPRWAHRLSTFHSAAALGQAGSPLRGWILGHFVPVSCPKASSRAPAGSAAPCNIGVFPPRLAPQAPFLRRFAAADSWRCGALLCADGSETRP